MTTSSQPRNGLRPPSAPRGVLVVLALIVALVAGCDNTTPSPTSSSPSAALAAPSAKAAPAKPSASAKVVSSPAPSRSSTPAPTATASLPAIVGATQSACPGTPATDHRGTVTTGQSRNWAGYVVGATKGHVTCVEGTWTQPSLRCPSSGLSSVVVWVGIDGSSAVGGLPDSSATLAQTGTTGDCNHGSAHYGAWFEFLPDLQHISPLNVPVKAGDKIWAQVRWLGKGKFMATLINLTQRIGATQGWTLRQAPLLTAEWVVEEPAARCSGSSCTFVTLARFSTVTLNGAVTINGRHDRLAAVPFPYLRTSINRSGKTLAAPSSLTSGGFSVVWKAS